MMPSPSHSHDIQGSGPVFSSRIQLSQNSLPEHPPHNLIINHFYHFFNMNTIHTSKNSSVTKFQKWGNVAQCQRVQKWSPAFQHYALAKVKVIEFIILNKVQHKLHDFMIVKLQWKRKRLHLIHKYLRLAPLHKTTSMSSNYNITIISGEESPLNAWMISLFLLNSGSSPLWSSSEQSQQLTHYS